MVLGLHTPGHLTAVDVPALEHYSDSTLWIAPVQGAPAPNMSNLTRSVSLQVRLQKQLIALTQPLSSPRRRSSPRNHRLVAVESQDTAAMCPFGECRPRQGSRQTGGQDTTHETAGQACSAEVRRHANDHYDC